MTTYLYTALLGILYFIISLIVIKARGTHKISLGSGDSNEIIHLVSAHSNFSSYTPFFLFSLYLLEIAKVNFIILHTLGFVFLLGRFIHFLTMKNQEKTFKFRKTGMMMTLWPLIINSILLMFIFMKDIT